MEKNNQIKREDIAQDDRYFISSLYHSEDRTLLITVMKWLDTKEGEDKSYEVVCLSKFSFPTNE